MSTSRRTFIRTAVAGAAAPSVGPRLLDGARAAARGVPGPAAGVRRHRGGVLAGGPQGCSRPTRTTSTSRTATRARSRCRRGTPSSATSRPSTTACPSTCGAARPPTTRRSSSSSPALAGCPAGRDRHHAQHHGVAGHGDPRHRPRAGRRGGHVRPGLRDDAGAVPASSRAAGACRCVEISGAAPPARRPGDRRHLRPRDHAAHEAPAPLAHDQHHRPDPPGAQDRRHGPRPRRRGHRGRAPTRSRTLVFSVPDLDGDYLGASLHKWLCTPLGAGLLHVKKDKIRTVWPLLGETSVPDDDIRKLERIGTHPVWTVMAIADAIGFHTSGRRRAQGGPPALPAAVLDRPRAGRPEGLPEHAARARARAPSPTSGSTGMTARRRSRTRCSTSTGSSPWPSTPCR
ncbi:MAG: hypothetical protein MZW92_40505 [Comamonadaceae bacterium]|nr:hypothetical protein [Comamonadaceae bacterium]